MLDFKKLQKEGLRLLDMHSHTSLSDGTNTVEQALRFAKINNFGLCITDHNEIKGSLYLKNKIFTLYGEEITSSEYIDILVYFSSSNDLTKFHNKYIIKNKLKQSYFKFHKTSVSTADIIENAGKFNSLIAIPHPNGYHPKKSYVFFNKNSNNKNLLKKVDAIEGINSMMPYHSNKRAMEWADELKKPVIASTDAHSLNILGYAVTACYAETRDDFMEAIRKKQSIVYSNQYSELKRRFEAFRIVWNNIKLI